jgi:hypothetical protein
MKTTRAQRRQSDGMTKMPLARNGLRYSSPNVIGLMARDMWSATYGTAAAPPAGRCS